MNELLFLEQDLPKELSQSELKECFKKMSEGDIDSRNKIIEHNIRLVLYRLSNRFKMTHNDKDDLVSVGLIGLIKAVDTYDINKDVKFSSYATKCIDNEILMYIRKAKKYSGEVSLDTSLNDIDDDSLNLLDTICDDDDFVENLVENDNSSIIYKAINEFVEELSPRNRDIVKLCFGFGIDASPMSQEEVGKIFGFSRSYISRILKQCLIEIKKGLITRGLVESSDLEIKGLKPGKYYWKEKKEMSKLQSIYEYFKNYTKKQVDEMLNKLTDEERELITIRYGKDLNNPVFSKLTNKQTNRFYGTLLPKMKKLLEYPDKEYKSRKRKEQVISTIPTAEVLDSNNMEQTTIVSGNSETHSLNEEKENVQSKIVASTTPSISEEFVLNNEKEMTKEEYIKILELLKTAGFSEMLKVLSPKEAVIVCLKLGYVDGKYFSTDTIAQFLGIDEEEIIQTTKKVLLVYRESIDNYIEKAISFAAEIGKSRS